MKKNMGTADRVLRLIVAILFITFFVTENITGTLGIVLIALAVVFVLTSFIGFCPLYTLFGITTCKLKSKDT
jgi:hypothetical protein